MFPDSVPATPRQLAPVPAVLWQLRNADTGQVVDRFADHDSDLFHDGFNYQAAEVIHLDDTIEFVFFDHDGRKNTLSYPAGKFILRSLEVDV
jgi:hypothetical protein